MNRKWPLPAHRTPRAFLALNGLRRQGRDVRARLAAVETVIVRHGQMLEVVDDLGEPYRSFFLSCERGLSMAAGQYLELLSAAPAKH